LQPSVLIIGAGISGLCAALQLQQQGVSVRIIDARDRIGGRALSQAAGRCGAVDLGPAWIWPDYQPRVSALIKSLALETLPQFEHGELIYETATELQRIRYPTRYHDTVRLRLGIQGLAQALADQLAPESLALSTVVTHIELTDTIRVSAMHRAEQQPIVFKADKIIVAVPGPLATTWQFTPALPPALTKALGRWPTWMAAQAKFVALYSAPFWRDQGLSGSAISHRGPLMEIADQSDPDAGYFALFGFFGWSAEQRRVQKNQLASLATQQLARLFGEAALTPLNTYMQDWSTEVFTATQTDLEPPHTHPPYGEKLLREPALSGRLVFAGAEAAAESGGLIEGAVAAGQHAATLAMTAS